jgi:hypothetical protein
MIMPADRVIYLRSDELEEFTEIKKTREHVIYDCPYCATYYGTNSKNFYPKLYYHPQKGVGYCFRCNTAILVRDIPPEDRIYIPAKSNSAIQDLTQEYELLFSPANERSIDYLLSRSPYLEKLGIPEHRFTKLPRPGVVFPIWLDNHIYAFQIRFMEGEPRYYTSSGTKLLYHAHGIDFNESISGITLVEGIFGSFGAQYLGLPFPIAIFGHHLTDFQLALIKRLDPQTIWIAMDEPKLNLNLQRELQKEFPLIAIDCLDLGDLDDLASLRYHLKYT